MSPHATSRRAKSRRWRSLPLVLFVAFVVFIFWLQPKQPLRGDKQAAGKTDTPVNAAIGKDDQLDGAALHLVAMDLQRGKTMNLSEERETLLRCAFLTLSAVDACAKMFSTVFGAAEKQGGAGAVLLLPLMPDCPDKNVPGDVATDFLRGTSSTIMQQLPIQIGKMRRKAEENGLAFPSLESLREGILRASAPRCENASLPARLKAPHDLAGEISDVQVVSAEYLFPDTHSFSVDTAVANVVGAATTTYLLLPQPPSTSRVPVVVDTFVKVVAKHNCDVVHLTSNTAESERAGATHSTTLMWRVRCPHTKPAESPESAGRSPLWHRVDVAARSPLLCEHLTDRLVLSRVVKYGTKTAVLRGQWRGKEVMVKVLHPYHYFSFQGLRVFMQALRKRSPLIHYPTFSCYSTTHDAIFQFQQFLSGYTTLNSLMLSRGKHGALSLRQRVEIAVQIVCIFQFLHEEHPAGLFAYSDNHPSQYLLKEGSDGLFHVRLIDIDTLQQGIAQAITDTPYPYSNYSLRCRCFYCRGRSNCLFYNTYEAYKACGQLQDRHAWNSEMPHAASDGRVCDGSTDMWFEAQLLYLLFDGTPAWSSVGRDDLLHRIEMRAVPSLKRDWSAVKADYSEAVSEVLSHMFLSRPKEESVLQKLRHLCEVVGCRVAAKCPAPVPSSTGLYSSPLNLQLR